MDGIEFAHVVGGPAAKLGEEKAFQIAFPFQFCRKPVDALRNLVAERKRKLPRPGNIQSPELSGPCINVVENVSVNGPNML